MQIWALIVDSIRESRDKKLFWIMLVVSTMAAGVLACIGFDENGWSLFFGAIKIENPAVAEGTPAASAMMASMISRYLIGTYIGWVGVIACLAATAGMFPTFLESGSIDVVLSKPMSRGGVFIGKYLGSLTFVLAQSTYFVLLTFVIMRWQFGRWLWGYLWAIPLLVALFSYIYCVLVLVAVWSRSTLTALICSLLFWMTVAGTTAMESERGFARLGSGSAGVRPFEERDALGKAIYVLNVVFPKTEDIPVIVGRQIGAGGTFEFLDTLGVTDRVELSDQDLRELRVQLDVLDSVSTVKSLSSSLAFEAVILLWAGWIFSRRDF